MKKTSGILMICLLAILVVGCASDVGAESKTEAEILPEGFEDTLDEELAQVSADKNDENVIVIQRRDKREILNESEPINIIFNNTFAQITMISEVSSITFTDTAENNIAVIPAESKAKITDNGKYNKVYYK